MLPTVYRPRLHAALCIACESSLVLSTRVAEGQAPEGIAVGASAPSVTVTELNGNVLQLGPSNGRPMVIEFWATWCEFCERLEYPSPTVAETRNVGDMARDFTAPAADSAGARMAAVALHAMRGRVVVLAFYPKDRSGGCTAELTNCGTQTIFVAPLSNGGPHQACVLACR